MSDGIRHGWRACVCVREGGRGAALLPRQAGSEAEVDGQAIQPPFTFNERAPRLLARSLARSLVCSFARSLVRVRRCFMRRRIANTSYENRQRRRFNRVSAL